MNADERKFRDEAAKGIAEHLVDSMLIVHHDPKNVEKTEFSLPPPDVISKVTWDLVDSLARERAERDRP